MLVYDENKERFQVDPVFGRNLDKSIPQSSSWINITPVNKIKAEQVVSRTTNSLPPASPSSDDDIEIIYEKNNVPSNKSAKSVAPATQISSPRLSPSPSAQATRLVATPVLTNLTTHNITNLIGSPSLEVRTVPSPVPTPRLSPSSSAQATRSVATPVLTHPTPYYITNLIGSPSLEVGTVPSPVPTPQFTNLFGSPPLASFNFYNSPVYTPYGQNVNNFLVPHTQWSPWSPNPYSLNPFSPNPLSPMMHNVYMGYNQDANSELEESLDPKRRRNASPPLNTPAQSPFSSNQTE
jgi:hypothetical protein